MMLGSGETRRERDRGREGRREEGRVGGRKGGRVETDFITSC
jgi:hypothetical protein